MAIVSLLLAAALASAPPALDPCNDLSDIDPTAPARTINLTDLTELTDFGGSDTADVSGVFGVSPNGRQLAVVTRRANPATNSYCMRLLVMPSDGSSPPHEVDRGGDFARTSSAIWSLASVPQGTALLMAPSWSPDGKLLAYARRDHGSTQIWLVPAAGGAARQVTHLVSDVEKLAWSPDGQALILAYRPGLAVAQKTLADEGLKGWLYDDRFGPMKANHPWPHAPMPKVEIRFDLRTSELKIATPQDRAAFDPEADREAPADAEMSARDTLGNRAWSQPADAHRYWSPTKLSLKAPDGHTWTCNDNACARIQHLWWIRPGLLIFMGRQGWANGDAGLYSWRIGDAQPKQILSTRDALMGCEPAQTRLLCAEETSLTPRRIITIDLRTGQRAPVYEPNAGIAHMRLGTVQHINIRNSYGIESWADLVLPPDHRPGEKHPLVLVQYRSKGFLRGGTGDEVPIQFLAARGFAVLSFERPMHYGWFHGAKNDLEFRRINQSDFIDHRSVLSSMQEAVRLAIATGAVDADHMGISGFSDGTANTQFALIHSHLFSVASLGSCCEEQIMLPLMGGPGYERYQRESGLPGFDDVSPEARAIWSQISLRLNADHVRTPILAQVGDSEYTAGLEVELAWRERGNPFELYVMPDEPHWKWQPAHRLAMYERTADWFSFWLMGKVDCDPTKAAQYDRWSKMKGAPVISSSSCLAQMPVP